MLKTDFDCSARTHPHTTEIAAHSDNNTHTNADSEQSTPPNQFVCAHQQGIRRTISNDMYLSKENQR